MKHIDLDIWQQLSMSVVPPVNLTLHQSSKYVLVSWTRESIIAQITEIRPQIGFSACLLLLEG